jgi:hypothetical protein
VLSVLPNETFNQCGRLLIVKLAMQFVEPAGSQAGKSKRQMMEFLQFRGGYL